MIYDDIINMKYEKSLAHKHMSLEERSAQFAPFAALAGYEEAVKETARLTDDRKEIDEGLKAILNYKLEMIMNNYKDEEITFTYFEKDKYKDGGKYKEETGIIKKIDDINKIIILKNNKEIKIDDILNIDCENLNEII